MLQSLLVYCNVTTIDGVCIYFEYLSYIYMAWFVKDISMEQYHFGWLITYFLNSRFFCCLQDINLI